jgi:predicted DNA-binding transcriptional regulator AlpA
VVHRRGDRGGDGDDHRDGGDDDHRGDDDRQRRLPVFVRYKDLLEAGIVRSWQQLFRIIDSENFPEGVLLSPNIRAWRLDEVEHWLADRPTARKVLPEGATPHKRRETETA